MIIDYSLERCVDKINIARQLRAGQEPFCQIIEYYIRIANDYSNTNPGDDSEYNNDVIVGELTRILEQVRANIATADKTFSKIELFEQARLINQWLGEQQIDSNLFPNVCSRLNKPPLQVRGEYINLKHDYENS